ncbi:hypothetical protein EYC80_010060 [Monilinia laxa]|uniref:Uncharacterized protein n=1 Tax=Monilinia laxa TaxID=61186 RepID=A0A5N6JRI0_MONLA|nr:hypothetical protein EYC80_010060 [Monilinia laxa]
MHTKRREMNFAMVPMAAPKNLNANAILLAPPSTRPHRSVCAKPVNRHMKKEMTRATPNPVAEKTPAIVDSRMHNEGYLVLQLIPSAVNKRKACSLLLR